MKTFVEMYRFPVVREFDQKSAEDIFGKEKSAVFIFNDLNKSDQLEVFREVADKFKNDLIFSHSEISNGLGQRLSEFVGITSSDVDKVVAIRYKDGNMLKYSISNFNFDSLS